jgi:hypothetical protein
MFLLCTLLRVNASLMPFLRQPCLEKISLTFPAVEVFPMGEVYSYIWRPYFKWIFEMYLSGLANKLELQLLAWSCHGQRVQKFEVSSTGSLAVLNSQFSKPVCRSKTFSYQCWRRGADRAHELPYRHSPCLQGLGRHCIKNISTWTILQNIWIKTFLREQYC